MLVKERSCRARQVRSWSANLLQFEFFDVRLTNFSLLLAKDDINTKLNLDSDMAKVHQALNISAKFCE